MANRSHNTGSGSSNINGQSKQNNEQSNSGNGGRSNGNPNEKCEIPDEVGNPDCPVCLCRVQNRAYTNTCKHEFCFPCIHEWSRSHNKCPVCREIYQKILYNIRSKKDYDEEEVEEPLNPSNGLLVLFDDIGVLFTPETGLYIINPRQTSHGIQYNIEFAGPHQRIVLFDINPNMIFVNPEELENTLRQMNAHPHHPHHGSHPRLFRRHRRHNH